MLNGLSDGAIQTADDLGLGLLSFLLDPSLLKILLKKPFFLPSSSFFFYFSFS
jgi:hypothetical protein